MSFVLDASVTACWCFPDEQAAAADAAMRRLLGEEAMVPSVWSLEVRNILVVNERRGRIEPEDSDAFLRELLLLPIRIRPDQDESALLTLARKHQLTAYDAAYLDLAVRISVPVATLDRSLARAVRAEGLQVIAA
ncbi:MAG: type II toxin-antitoxin system VapC family toxin [Gammaproteobacteria bacterium]|nr:type II toxin-antitoxin system VapC family toxin [Gammaproteobacteria bacterium]MYK81127.1 type II toxin-antitoxin system VapC family toxin [Gammaproteobacteria bacterium]